MCTDWNCFPFSHFSIFHFSISERKLDGLSGDLVNGDHLSIPGMRDYPYGSLGAYNQMSPSPKSVTPQSPSSAPVSYTVGAFTMRSCLRVYWTTHRSWHLKVTQSWILNCKTWLTTVFLLPSLIVTSTMNELWKTETDKGNWNAPVLLHKLDLVTVLNF